MIKFFEVIIKILNEGKIPCMLSGSVAMSLYIVPRATRDFDFIVHLTSENLDSFVGKFAEGYYCDREQILDALNNPQYGMFNIIDHASGYKADFVVLKNVPFRQEEFSRRVQMDFYGKTIYVVSAEDLLQSDGLDKDYISKWINTLKLKTFNLPRL